jgi:hypothetical protein
MGKGYAEGPAMEEHQAALERGDTDEVIHQPAGRALYGATAAEPESHFLGWLEDIDPDQLFASGQAWGLKVVRRVKTSDAASA